MKQYLATLLFIFTIAAPSLAQTPALVGTWQKADKSLVEFKLDGTITANGNLVAKWQVWPQSGNRDLYIVRFANQLTNFKTFVARYQRQLTLEHPGTCNRTLLERVDNGPTLNPDVPDARTALNMERADTERSIEETALNLEATKREAAEAYQRHYDARAIGRISAHLGKAKALEASAASMERSLINLRYKLADLGSKLASQ